jgi:integrase
VRKYSQALRTFGRWAIADGDDGPEAVMRLLCECGPAAAHAMAEQWRDELLAAGKAPATVGGLLSALGSLVRACRRVGLVQWTLEAVAPKPEKRCDRRGPPRGQVERLFDHVDELAEAGDRSAIRDAALLRLLHNAALRRQEVASLEFPRDIDLDGADGPCVCAKRKGKRERGRQLIGEKAAASLRTWIAVRGDWHGALFHRLQSGTVHGALSGEAIRLLVKRRAKAAGLRAPVRPHGLRHSSASACAARGTLDQLMALGSWSTLSAASRYLDERQETRAAAIGIVEV